jgi:zinc protease
MTRKENSMNATVFRASPRRSFRLPAILAAAMLLLASCAGAPAAREAAVPAAAPATTPAAAAAEPPAPVALPTRPDQVRLDALEARFAAGTVGGFAAANLASFTSFSLGNGIPVVIKRNEATRVRSISVVLRGGALLAPPGKAGIESIMLKTMARGSAAVPYYQLRSKLDETSSAIGSEIAFEHSVYTLTTLDKYFDELLPLWAGTLTAPGWNGQDFDQVLSDAKLSLKKKDQDPWQAAATAMNQAFFAGHPYAATPEGTKDSLAALSLEAVRDYYDKTLSANRLFIVAVGNYDPATLRPALEAAFGAVADRKVGVPYGVPGFAGKAEGKLVKREFAASKGVGYLRGDFAAPAPTDPDYPATSLAMKMLSDLLFNVVRDKYGAVYTPGAYIRVFPANYGSITIFKTSVASKVKGYIDEAVGELAAGRVTSMAPGPDAGKEPRQSIAEALPVYKALYLSETYEKISTNAAVAGEIARSVLLFGDPRAWLLDVDRIAAVTPEEVAKAVKERLLDAKVTWVVLGSKDVVDPVDPAAFLGFRKP